MNTYVAQIIFSIKCADVSSEQYEEQWRVVFANDDREALNEAKKIGLTEESTFIDRHGRAITWVMVAVKDLKQVDIKHGAQLFSTVKEVTPIAAPVWSN